MKKLPIGISDFERLITDNYLYVDKTRYIYQMATEGMFYFLSRPRRFGKSLLVSTLEYLFKGNKDLFQGLWIEKANWEWQPHPIVKFDFSEIDHDTPEKLNTSLLAKLYTASKENKIRIRESILRTCFSELIIRLFEKYRQKVVILIDEYDQPLISHLGRGKDELEIAKQNREALRNFFGVLKGGNVNKALQFVFLTGISKFARVSIFSELNNLDDISIQDTYCKMLGYTEEELQQYFHEHIQQLATRLKKSEEETRKDIQTWYNGYRFTDLETKVYNPFSVLKLFKNSKFHNYWFETATPAFLVNLIKERQYPIPDIEKLQLQEMSFSTYDLDRLNLEPLLFQTGYITIQGFDGIRYQLGYPNQEVKTGFLSYLYHSFVEIPSTTLKEQYSLLYMYLAQKDVDQFIETVNAIFSAIPYPHIYDQDEHYYHTVFYLMLSASGVLVHSEVLSALGRVDMEVHFPGSVYIVELKCNQSAEQAIAQIKKKKYAKKYQKTGKKIILLGINFSTEERRVVDWRKEEM